MKELILITGGVMATFVMFIALLIVPSIYLEGAAKSDWIRHTRGIEMPWYRAAFLNIEVMDMDAEVKTKP
jgi:hypothetical protein